MRSRRRETLCRCASDEASAESEVERFIFVSLSLFASLALHSLPQGGRVERRVAAFDFVLQVDELTEEAVIGAHFAVAAHGAQGLLECHAALYHQVGDGERRRATQAHHTVYQNSTAALNGVVDKVGSLLEVDGDLRLRHVQHIDAHVFDVDIVVEVRVRVALTEMRALRRVHDVRHADELQIVLISRRASARWTKGVGEEEIESGKALFE